VSDVVSALAVGEVVGSDAIRQIFILPTPVFGHDPLLRQPSIRALCARRRASGAERVASGRATSASNSSADNPVNMQNEDGFRRSFW
jgi:hypothetical protein